MWFIKLFINIGHNGNHACQIWLNIVPIPWPDILVTKVNGVNAANQFHDSLNHWTLSLKH